MNRWTGGGMLVVGSPEDGTPETPPYLPCSPAKSPGLLLMTMGKAGLPGVQRQVQYSVGGQNGKQPPFDNLLAELHGRPTDLGILAASPPPRSPPRARALAYGALRYSI